MRCTLTRWRLSRHADDGGALPSRVAAHLETCAACERHRATLENLSTSLRAGRPDAPRPLTESDRGGARRLGALALAGAVAAAAVFALVRAPNVALVANVETPPPELAQPSKTTVPSEPPIDSAALASDAQDGLRYVLRVSGLSAARRN